MKTSSIIAITAASVLGFAAVGAATAAAASMTAHDRGPASGNRGPQTPGGPQGSDGPQGPGGPQRPDGPHGDHHGMGGPGGPEGPRGDVLHGEMVVEEEDGTIVTLRMQEGEVTAASPTSISVRSTDGFTSTYVITADTEQERDRDEAASAEVGDTVHVRATVDGATATADDIHALSPEAAATQGERGHSRG